MASFVFDIIRQGILASVTGGWYYEPRHTTFINAVHLYLFLFLLCFPLTVSLYFPHDVLSWLFYVVVTGGLIISVKLINCTLHRLYDSSEAQYDAEQDQNISANIQNRKKSNNGADEEEGIELQVFTLERKQSVSPQLTQDIEDIYIEDTYIEDVYIGNMSRSNSDLITFSSRVPAQEVPISGTIDLKVDVHRRGSSSSSSVSDTDSSRQNGEPCTVTTETEISKPEGIKISNENSGAVSVKVDSVDAVVASSSSGLTTEINKDDSAVPIEPSSATNAGRLSEKSRRYSVSVTLGSTEQPIMSDPGPSRSLQLDEDLAKTEEEEKGLLFWKQKLDNTTEHSKSDSIISPTSALPMYKSDTVYSIEERSDECKSSSISLDKRGSDCSEEESEHEEGYCCSANRKVENDDDEYGDVEDDEDNSRSPLLMSKRKMRKTMSSEIIKTSSHSPSSSVKKMDTVGGISNSTGKLKSLKQKTSDQESKENVSTLKDSKRYPDGRMCRSSPNLPSHNVRDVQVESFKDKSQEQVKADNLLVNKEHNPTLEESGKESESSLVIDMAVSMEKTACAKSNEDSVSSSKVIPSKLEVPVKVTESNEASSSGSNNELSSLLPTTAACSSNVLFPPAVSSPPLIPLPRRLTNRLHRRAQYRPRRPKQRTRLIRHQQSVNGSVQSVNGSEEESPSSDPFSNFTVLPPGAMYLRHLATAHEDTSEGAVHLFQDENGEWMSYMFDSEGTGVALSVDSLTKMKHPLPVTLPEKGTHSNAGFDSCTLFVNSGLRSRFLEDTATGSATASSPWTNTIAAYSVPQASRPSLSSAVSAGTTTTTTASSRLSSYYTNALQRDNRSCAFEPPTHRYRSSRYTLYLDSAPGRFSRQRPRMNRQIQMDLDSLRSVAADISSSGAGGSGTGGGGSGAGGGGGGIGGVEGDGDCEADGDAVVDFLEWPELQEEESNKYTGRFYRLRLFSRFTIKVYFDRLKLLDLFDHNRNEFEVLLSIFLSLVVSFLGALMLFVGFYRDLCLFLFCFVMAGSQYSLLKSVQPDIASPTHGFNRIVAFSRPVYFIICTVLILTLHFILHTCENWNSFVIYGVLYNPRAILEGVHNFLLTFVLYFPVVFAFGMMPQFNTFLMYLLEQIEIHLFGGSGLVSLKAGFYCVFRGFLAVFTLFGFAYAGLNEPKSTQHILFSIFISVLVIVAYHLSRTSSDPVPMWNLLERHFWPLEENVDRHMASKPKATTSKGSKHKRSKRKINNSNGQDVSEAQSTRTNEAAEEEDNKSDSLDDPLPMKLRNTMDTRLQSDLIVSVVVGIVLFVIHRSMIFSALQPELNPVMWSTAAVIGFVLHYLIPQMRKQLPWMCIAKPILMQIGIDQFEPRGPSKVTYFEKGYLYFGFVERNIIYPVMFIGCMTYDGPLLTEKIGPLMSSLLITLCGLKCLRLSFSSPSHQYIIVIFSVLLFQKGYFPSETFVVDYFVTSIMYFKVYDLLLKMKFVMTYIAPWQITWGSAFHAFAQPFSLPHTGMLFAQVILSAILSSPLYPFLGSAIFLTSYPRPIKFWERDYNTRRADHSNTKLSSHLDRNLGTDDNNLNSIFYEHLTRSLQHSLCGDLQLGRWGEISAGDIFVLASDYLNCMIHIIEVGNGFVTFQMRGLEFRGTYCQQREVEAITEGVGNDDGCCCCNPGHLPNILALNVAFRQRWLAWEVIVARYVIEGYSIADNSASSILQVFDFRKMLITYYVKSIIYYIFVNSKLDNWILNTAIMDALQPLKDKSFIDLDPVFNVNIDEDFDYRLSGISKSSFNNTYGAWIRCCNNNREVPLNDVGKDSNAFILCFALCLLGRRVLGSASHNTASSVEFFLYGLHALFKGDFRIGSTRDEWVFSDMDLLHKVVKPAIRMALKLHQDHFMAPDEFESPPALYATITSHDKNLVISHEGDPIWRKAVLSGMPSLLALRRVNDEGNDEYKVIMLNKRYLSFRLIKLNRECVRGLWSSQQQELVYFRNRNPERGSIQNVKHILRNIINSSCDQPIGYPIFVSPITTSYIESNEQIQEYLGGPITLKTMRNYAINIWRRIRHRFIEGCSSGSSVPSQDDGTFGHEGVYAMTTFNVHSGYGSTPPTVHSLETALVTSSGGTITRVSRPSIAVASTSKPGSTSLVSLAGFLSPPGASPNIENLKSVDKKTVEKEDDDKEKDIIMHRVRIIDPVQVHDGINQGRLIDVIWPDEMMRQRGGRNFWKDWIPEDGMEGQVVHRWVPNHPNPNKRSTFDRTILLVKIDDKYVPISESGVQDLGAEV